MQAHATMISSVAPERIAEELRKLLQAQTPSQGFRLMYEVDLLQHILPELQALVGVSVPALPCDPHAARAGVLEEVWTRTLHRLDAAQQCSLLQHRGDVHILLAALLQDCGYSPALPHATTQECAQLSAMRAAQALERLKMTTIGVSLKLVTHIITHSAFSIPQLLEDTALRHFAHMVGVQETLLVFDLRLASCVGQTPDGCFTTLLALSQRLQTAVGQGVALTLKDLAVNGHDLQQLGIPPGPRLGEVLQVLLQRVLDNPACNTRAELLHTVQSELLAASC
jgi:hypothetical protein